MESHTETSTSASTYASTSISSSSSSPHLPSNSPAYFSRCPSAILLQLANDFLLDRDVARWAATERRMLSVLHAYSIKRTVTFDEAWKFRWGSLKALIEAVSNPNPHSDSGSGSGSNGGGTSSSSSTSSSTHASTCTSSRSPFRIGRLRATIVDDYKTIQEIIKSREQNDDVDGEDESAFMQRLMSSYLPTSVECIIFQLPLNSRFLSCNLPHHLTQLCIDWLDPRVRQSELESLLAGWILPPSLHSLRIDARCALPLNRLTLPHSLTKLHLGGWHVSADQLPTLPPNLRVLNMGSEFNHPIDSIQWPHSLQSLTLSKKFNQPLESVRLPDSITYLKIGDAYNHPIERMHLPASLTHLQFDWDFSQPLRDWNPPASLTHLRLAGALSHGPSQLRLPANLQVLTLSRFFNGDEEESLSLLHLPSHIHTLTLGGVMEGNALAALTFPPSLTVLDLGSECDACLGDVRWPPHLTRLVTGMMFQQPLVYWSPPSSLTELNFGGEDDFSTWNLPVTQLHLPSNLQRLTFSRLFDQPLTFLQFPPSLRVIRFGERFNQSLAAGAWTPPPGLEELILFGCWNRPCTDLHLPPKLRKLTLPFFFNQPVENEHGACILNLPDTLVELRFGETFNQSLRNLQLPHSLRFLSLPNSYCYNSITDNRIQPPLSLPPRFQCLEVYNESAFEAQGWAQHPQWPQLIQHCGTAVVYIEERKRQNDPMRNRDWRDVTKS